MQPAPDDASLNRRTIASYERIARDYAASTAGAPSGVGAAALLRLVDAVGAGGRILELGSGPGWDADFLEAHGLAVRRTDVTTAFCDLQAERGKRVERLDAITGDYPLDAGPYDAVVALCVLLHVERDRTGQVLAKVRAALRPGGWFLVSVREGSGEVWESSTVTEGYHVVFWEQTAFEERLAAAGLPVVWSARSLYGDDEAWVTFLARAGAVAVHPATTGGAAR